MTENTEWQEPPPTSDWLTSASERTGAVWGLVTKGGLLALGLFVFGVIVYEVGRECLSDVISLEPVIVKGPVGDGGPTVEMATQQIATYIDKIQRTGAREWRPLAFTEGEQTVSIQIPGSSFNVESIVREIAGLFPHRRRVLKISITANPSGTGYVAAIAIARNGSPKRKTCEMDNKPGALGKMFECIAIEAMKAVDPLFAASYVLSVEEERCSRFEPEHLPPTDPVADEKRLLQMLRDYCGFALTRSLVSTIIDRGRMDDQPWVSYIYGKLHLARADAVAKVDSEAQWYEFDRAIRRFDEFSQNNLPASAKAIQMEAYIKNGLSIQESVRTLDWNTQGDFIKYRLDGAAKILADAAQRLEKPVDQARKAPTLWEAVAFGVEPALIVYEDRPAAMVSHMHGLILYRQWMIDTRARYQNGQFGFAESAEERTKLEEALKFFDAANRQSKHTFEFFIEWGNALRALRKFDEAIEQYRRAGDIAPNSSVPLLNVAVALLEKSKGSTEALDHFEALRQTSSYLTWISEGGPFDRLVDRIADALRGIDDGGEAEDFAFCRWMLGYYEADSNLPDLSHTAGLEFCVDQARDSLSRRVVEQKAKERNIAEQKVARQQ
jgi:tetratricopeptide (TPR) repeat protein